MQSDRKHRKEPRNKQLAKDYAIPYSLSVEELGKAINQAKRHSEVAKETASRQSDRLEKKYAMNTSHFWTNVVGELLKYQKSLKSAGK